MSENVVIRLEGRFDFSCFKAFQAQYEPLLSNAQVLIRNKVSEHHPDI